MLALLPLLCSLSSAAPVTVDGHPLNLEPTDGWSAAVRGERALTLANRGAMTELMFEWSPGIQPDLSEVDPATWATTLADAPDLPEDLELGPFTTERLDHPVLGPVLLSATEGRLPDAPVPVQMRLATFAGPAGVLHLAGGVYQSPERADALVREALDQVRWKKGPFGADDFQTGRVELDAGYALELPEGWRRLHPDERDRMELPGERVLFLDPGRLDGAAAFGCVVNRAPLDVVPEDADPLFARNYRTRTRALLSGGSFVSRGLGGATRTQVDLSGTAIRVAPDAEGTLETVELGDRAGYLWRVPGTVSEEPVEVLALYTTWDARSVDCTWAAAPDHPATPALETTFRSVRVVDGASHPQPLSVRARYVSAWPFRHPLLQIWTFGLIPVLGLGAWLWRYLR